MDDCLYNVIHDIVLQSHREEKILRMQSAATIAEQAATAQVSSTPVQLAKSGFPPPPAVRLETPGAIYDNGRICLRGNPLKTTPEILCPQCKLPRLLYPISGVGSQTPDLTKQYCTRHPFISKPGHDIYGNLFPTDIPKTKKERELLKAQARAEKDSTPGSQDTRGTATPPDPSAGPNATANVDITNSILKLTAPSKPASYIPWHTCPNCKRSLLITRFAQHLEKCLGISGRASSRNAMAKLAASTGQGSGASGTPHGSRMGTPTPSQSLALNGKKTPIKKGNVDADADEDKKEAADSTGNKKGRKKSNYMKKADRERSERAEKAEIPDKSANETPSKIKLSTSGTPKRLAKPTSLSKETSSDKRERDDDSQKDDGEESPRKKIRLASGAVADITS